MTSSLGIAPLLKPVETLNQKWLDRDPQDALGEECLFEWYNELLKEKEIYIRPDSVLNRDGFASHKSGNGHYYCGQVTLTCDCCNGVCGPSFGCNCKSCQEIEEELKENKDLNTSEVFLLREHIEAWSWGQLPTLKEMKNFTKLVSHKQLTLFKKSTESIKFLQHLKSSVYVYSRFLSVYSRTCFDSKNKSKPNQNEESSGNLTHVSSLPTSIESESEFVHSGLYILFKSMFKFLKTSWMEGNRNEFCTELLSEALLMFKGITKPLLTTEPEKEKSKLLIGFLEYSSDFLAEMINSPADESKLLICDKKSILILMFEIAFQTASLSGVIKVILLYLQLCQEGILTYLPLNEYIKKLMNQLFQMDFVPEIISRYYNHSSFGNILLEGMEFSRLLNEADPDAEEKCSEIVKKLLKVLLSIIQPFSQVADRDKANTKANDELVWGNLKLLSSLKEEKMTIKIATICCTDTLVIILTLSGKIFCCEHNNEQLDLKPYKQVEGLKITQLSCSFDGHFIALTNDGTILTWRDVNNIFEHMSPVPLKITRKVSKLFAGFGYYAVVTDGDEVCIWENTLIGRANHDQHHDQFLPRTFPEFENSDVIDISFSQYHPEVIIVTKGGRIWCWENGVLLLLSESYPNTVKIYIAKYFYVALSDNGQVYRWGRDQFAKSSVDNQIEFQPVVKLSSENIVSLSVGAYHCIAITDSSNVYCWGGLGGKEEDETLIREPVLLKVVSELGVSRVVAGPHQIFCWGVSFMKKLERQVPFAIDLKQETFVGLERLLTFSQDVKEEELKNILMQTCLSLLKLQFNAARIHDVQASSIGFDGKTEFSKNLKLMIIEFISSLPYHSTLHKLAEEVLTVGWLFLLPTAKERATTFSMLLKIKSESYTENHSFLLQLLMKCLLEKNGLEELLEDVISALLVKRKTDFDPCENTLFVLLKELFLVNTSAILKANTPDYKPEKIERDIMKVLLKFQRLLFARVFVVTEKDVCWPARCYVYEPTAMVKSLTTVVSLYITLIQCSCKQILTFQNTTTKLDQTVLQYSPCGILFQEFIVYLIILQNYAPIITSNCDTFAQFADLLDLYDQFNKSICNSDNDATTMDMAWPCAQATANLSEEENEEKEEHKGGDTALSQVSFGNSVDTLANFVGREVSSAIADVLSSEQMKTIVKKNAKDGDNVSSPESLPSATCSSTFKKKFLEAEQSIAFLLGLHCCYLAHGTYASHDETENKIWLHSMLFSAGVNRDTVLKDTKPQCGTGISIQHLLQKDSEPGVKILMERIFQAAQKDNIIIVPAAGDVDSIFELTTRAVFASMVFHCGVDEQLSRFLLIEDSVEISHDMKAIIKATLKIRVLIFQIHQESQTSYEELCKPIYDRCIFLCNSLNASQKPFKSHMKEKWQKTVEAVSTKYGYNWKIWKWRVDSQQNRRLLQRRDTLKQILEEIGQFLLDKKLSIDILRKCFLIQIKRAKQRLISGYLMQSLCLRQTLFQNVHYALMCGWLGLLVPGGSVSHAKPNILFNVELVPKDDIDKLKDVFHGFENFLLKALIDELESLKDSKDESKFVEASRKLLLTFTLLSSSVMSGDIEFMILCGVLEKSQHLLSQITKMKSNKPDKMHMVPFIDERKHRKIHLQELNGEEISKIMKIGSRVVRGADWKWDDQDGPHPSQGRVVSAIGEDGWVRVEWDTGSRNSYRMGKNGKYDLKLADTVQYFDEDDKEDTEKDATREKDDADKCLKENPISLITTSITFFLVNTLARSACNPFIKSNTVNAVTKFLIQSLKDTIEKSISAWGPDISVSAYFGFCRALCISPDIQEVVSVRDWITLLLKMFDLSVLLNNFNTGGNAFLIKIQLLKHVRFLLICKNRMYDPMSWKKMVLDSLFQNLNNLLQSNTIFTAETSQNHASKTSMAASPSTTIAEEIITLIHHLHASNDWADMINLKIWMKLRLFDCSVKMAGIHLQLISALAIIGGIDSRIRIGGLVEHEKYGKGTCVDILPNGKILLYFGTSLKPRLCHLSKLNIVPQSSINLHSIVEYQKKFSLFGFLLDHITFIGSNINWESSIDPMWTPYTRLYVLSLCCLKLLFKNPEILLKTMNEQKSVLIFNKLMEKALSTSPIQTTFGDLELEMASLSLSEEITSPTKKTSDNTTTKYIAESTDQNVPVSASTKLKDLVKDPATVNKTSEMIHSNPMLKLLVEMGFPITYIEHAMKELGEGARAEQLVSWLLQHPDLKEFEQRETGSAGDDDKGAASSVTSCSNIEQDHEYIVSNLEAAAMFGLPDTTPLKFPLGCLVRSLQNPDKNGLGTVLKVIGADENILVYWELHNKALWTTSDKIQLYDDASVNKKRRGGIQVGSHVKLKATASVHQYSMTPVIRNRIGTVTFIHPNDDDCTVTFDQLPLWHGSVQDLELVGPVHLHVTCDGCEIKPVIGVRYKCKTCEDFDFCENCFYNRTDHNHNFVAYHRSRTGQQPVEAGKPGQSRIQWCRSIPDKHQSIKEITVSSNEHMAAKMINQEMNLPWISEKTFGPHYIYLTLHPHILIKNISAVLDVEDNETYPTRFAVYAGSAKNQKQMVEDIKLKSNKTLIKLLGRQEEIYTYIEIKVFVGDGSTESACKICHLSVTGERRRKDYDQLIMKMISSVEKKEDLTEQVSYMKEQEHGFIKQKNVNKQVKAFCWGLNDKDQLGGLKGSKIKSPTVSQKLSSLNCKDIIGGSKTLYCVTYKGQVYSCGEATHGRLGLGPVTGNVAVPCLVESLKGYVIRKVAVHPGGKHCLAVTTNGECFSWGEGDDGKLGHGDKVSYSTPRLIESFIGQHVTNISCGSSHSAAIVSNKDLYTWGLGDYGRLGHGDEETHLVPKLVAALCSYNVTEVSCGSRDAQTIVLTDDGNVWSWGDGDFGKLGRGGSEGCLTPAIIPTLAGKGVCKILCGAQFSLALTKTGRVWTWGKGDFYRLGHGNDVHHREPKLVETLEGKQIVDVSVGALHCLAVTDEGEVYAWGDNDHGQQGTGSTTVNKTPTRLLGTDGHRILRVACGSSHSIAWAETNIASNILEDVIRFSTTCDPLGTNIMVQKHPFNPPIGNIAKIMKDQRPSLARTVLQINSNALQKEALRKILKAIEINFSRNMVIHCLKSIKNRPELYGQQWINKLRTLDVQSLVNFLKLALCGHIHDESVEILEQFLKETCYKNLEVSNCLIDTCIKELEDKIACNLILQEKYKPCVQESSHPYQGAPGVKLSGSVKYPGATMLHIEFNEQCQTEAGHDVLTFYDHSGRTLAMRTGHLPSDWNTKLKITGDELNWSFTTNSPGGLWGFSFVVTPVPPADETNLDSVSDNAVLKMPSLELVKKLLGIGIKNGSFNEMTILKLASLLATCIRIKLISVEEKKWILNQLHLLLLSPNAPPIDVPMIFNCAHFQDASVCKLRLNGNHQIHEAVLSSTLVEFITGVPQALLKQYEYEEGHVRSGDQLMFSSFLRSLALFACSLGVDALPVCSNKYRWAWFHKYCYAVRTAQSFIQNTELPKSFANIVREKLEDIKLTDETLCLDYENNDLFCKAQDEQILIWLKRRSQDWSVIWGGSGTIYGWGHNHRGQLGGVEGARIKRPTICDSLAALKPVQIVGGEQSLFCVTGDGRVYATGYGNSSRLGLGIVESVSVPRMIESIQHITIKKVSVHSGGRHSLALSTDGEVFSWGEGDDGKLGHGSRVSSNHPKLIETFRGKVISDIATGGSHSAAISEIGELFTWGKGRYGRLGHGDGEDQLRPKLVEALRDLCVIDVACGSGDAQTLCITSNDMVWSWGDGDYGKLGRGGSDGCKVPLAIDELTGKSIVKVECGSQFSMALSRHGVLYTWGKGDYYRLGHGTEDHVRRPKRVLAFEAKVVTSICCGSLHCVACTEDGEVYCWGDNDEGQLGDNTTNAGQQPKLCIGLQNKKIDRIACGSAHTLAWSTCESGGHSLPLQVPIEYNHLQELPISTIRNRALLLHSFSKLFCSCIPLMDLIEDCEVSCGSEKMINSLKGVLLCSFKENFFRKIIDLTMVRDRQHGPVIELNRVKKHRTERHVESDVSKSVFVQITSKISEFSFDSFCLPHRIWKVKFIGESVDDCGGGFSESIAEMCDELQNGSLPLLISTPNSEEESDTPSDYFLINSDANEKQHKEMFRFFGLILGIAIRCGSPLNLRLAEPMWKLLVGVELNIEDLEDIDRGFVSKHSYLSTLPSDNITIETYTSSSENCSPIDYDHVAALELPFTVRSSSTKEITLSHAHKYITRENRQEYLRESLRYRLNEFNQQIQWIRTGLSQVVPVPLLSLFTGPELENMVCGNPEIPVEALKSITSYRGIEPTSSLVKWFWQTLEDFTNHERSLFLRFVWGRTRLPRTAMDFKGKDFIFQALDKYNPPDAYLPESYTCFFLLKMPRYTSMETLKEKLKYAIYFCKSIDSDDYARIDLMHY